VVATGMDGASIAAIEPKIERRSLNVEPLRATVTPREPEAVAAQLEAEPALAAAEAAPALEPSLEEEQPDIFAQPLAAQAASETALDAPLTRIVDPAAAEEGDEESDAPLFAEPAYEPRKPRGGFLSIFGGRPRYDQGAAPAPQAHAPALRTAPAPSRGGALPVEAQAPAEEADQHEDLEIPSFLRRLAN